MSFQSVPGNLEPILREIKETKSEVNNTATELQNAQNTRDPNLLAEIQALKNELKNNNGKPTRDALDMASSKSGNGTSPKTLATGLSSMTGQLTALHTPKILTEIFHAILGGAPVAKQTATPQTNENRSRPTSNLNHVASRDSTNNGFGGCSTVRDRYGKEVDKDLHKQKIMSEMEQNGLGNVSTSTVGTNALMGTINLQNGIGNGSSIGHLNNGDIESMSLFTSGEERAATNNGDAAINTNAKDVSNFTEEEKASPVKVDKKPRDVDLNKPISYTTPIVPLPNNPPSQGLNHAQFIPEQPAQPKTAFTGGASTTSETPEQAKAKISPHDLQPGDQVVERVTRVHQGGLAPGPNGQPIAAQGKTLLTVVSAQGTKFALSDKKLAPGQKIVETVETVHEGFALPVTPSTSKRRWNLFGSLDSPSKDSLGSKASSLASPKAGMGGSAASLSDPKALSSDNSGEQSDQASRKSSLLNSLKDRSPSKETVKGKEKEKEGAEASKPSGAQQAQTQSRERQFDANWFDKIFDRLPGYSNDKLKSTVQN